MNHALPWDDQATLLGGVVVRVHAFDAAEADAESDAVLRLLPIFRTVAATALLPRWMDGGRSPADAPPLYQAGLLQARPDQVLSHGEGLISVVQQRGADARVHEPGQWRSRLGADRMLQCLATALAVAGHTGKPTVALLRGPTVLYQFEPSRAVLDFLATELPAAARHGAPAERVSAAQLARFCEPRLRALLGAEARPAVPA